MIDSDVCMYEDPSLVITKLYKANAYFVATLEHQAVRDTTMLSREKKAKTHFRVQERSIIVVIPYYMGHSGS